MKSLKLIIFLILCTLGASAQKKDISPEKAEAKALVKQGVEKIYNGNYEKAIVDFNGAIKKDSACQDAYLRRAFCYGATEKYNEAIADYSKIIKLNPEAEIAYVSRGSMKNKMKQFKEALLDFDKAMQLKPDDYEAYNNRGWAKKGLGDDNGACQDWFFSKKKGNHEAKIIIDNNHCK
jgi:tetratricopeptide (TPR) repeat protein